MAARLSEEVVEGGTVAVRTYLAIGNALILYNILINKKFHSVKS